MRRRLALACLAVLLPGAVVGCGDGGPGAPGNAIDAADGDVASGDAADGEPVGPPADAGGDAASAEALAGDAADACRPGDTAPGELGDLEEVPALPPAVAVGLEALPEAAACHPPGRPTGRDGDPFPVTLADTGCFLAEDERRPVAGLLPYDVNAPLWSDGARKQRWLRLPPGGKVRVLPDGDLDLPVGTLLFKHFELDGRPLETRLLVRHEDGQWAGYTYVFPEDYAPGHPGRDRAVLLGEAGARRLLPELDWFFPGRADCLTCHTEAAGRTLGLELAQLNGDFVYPGDRRANQLATWTHLGLFETVPGAPSSLPAYPRPGRAGELSARARAYLHANCAHCHRPGGLPGTAEPPELDLRFALPLAEARLVDVAPQRGSFGIPGAALVRPGAPARSVLLTRMRTTIANVRMPAIGSTVVDPLGVALVEAWIAALPACP